MEKKKLEITMNSARDLKKVIHLHAMDVYAAVTMSSNPQTEQRTPVDKGCGSNPMWNHTMRFTFDEAVAKMNYLFLNIKLMHHGHIRGDKVIGEVLVPVKELLDKAEEGNFVKYLTYQVREPSGKSKGELNLSYKFEDDAPIVTAYPPPNVGTSSSAYTPTRLNIPPTSNPPQSGKLQSPMGYPIHGGGTTPPPLPEGYPTPPPGLGYHHHGRPQVGRPQVVKPQQPGKINNGNDVGLELGMAVVGGMLGGLLMGELVSESDDAASNDADNTG